MRCPTGPDLAESAGGTGYDEKSIEKVIRLLHILQAIERDDFLHDRLALTGGTALNVFHLDLPRLSVDIDLMSVVQPGEVVGARREEIDEALGRVLKDQCRRMRGNPGGLGSRWEMRFDSAMGGSSAIKVTSGTSKGNRYSA